MSTDFSLTGRGGEYSLPCRVEEPFLSMLLLGRRALARFAIRGVAHNAVLVALAAGAIFMGSAVGISRAETHLAGEGEALKLESKNSSVAEALTAIGASYELRCSVGPGRVLNGTFSGSQAQIIASVMDGNDFVVNYTDGKPSVIIYCPSGKVAVASNLSPRVLQASPPTVTAMLVTETQSQLPSKGRPAMPGRKHRHLLDGKTRPGAPETVDMASLTQRASASVQNLAAALKLPPPK